MHRVKYKTDDLPKPGLELLVHNISHADMLVALREMPLDEDGSREGTRTFLARPQFNSFMPVSKAIEDHLEKLETGGVKPGVISCISTYGVHYPTGLDLEVGDTSSGVELKPSPRLQRLQNFLSGGASSGSPVGDEADSGDDGSKPSPKPGTKAATAWSLFHLKGDKDGNTPMGRELAVRQSSAPRVIAVYLPLLAVVLPEWIRSINRRMQQMADDTPSPRKVLVLVSGAGQPRDVKANPADNSTEGTGQLIERFLRIVHPDIEVVHITSAYGIFRYDDNVRFVKEQVLPIIESKRTDVVADHHEHWTRHLKVTVCLADGAPARISALNAACRSYRPDYLHVWRTKTFWDTQTLCEEDVESHTFKKLEMRYRPSRTTARLPTHARARPPAAHGHPLRTATRCARPRAVRSFRYARRCGPHPCRRMRAPTSAAAPFGGGRALAGRRRTARSSPTSRRASWRRWCDTSGSLRRCATRRSTSWARSGCARRARRCSPCSPRAKPTAPSPSGAA
jgi:hypothetical protein